MKRNLHQRNLQRGQALIYGLFVLASGAAALFFMFNTGQLAREKTKLVNTADAVAYSAGVMNARAMNFHSYTNRAMVANTVAIAQLVSLSSWLSYADNLGTYGSFVALQPKFEPFYPSYYAAANGGRSLHQALNQNGGSLERLARGSDEIVRRVLMGAQRTAHAGLFAARAKLMDEVAQANYDGDGSVQIEMLPGNQDYFQIVSNYDGEKRTRFAEVAKKSAKIDNFVSRRSWFMPALPFVPDQCLSANMEGRFDWFDRRGGTALIGFDEWKAMDTLSEKRWVPKNKTDVLCQGLAETPTGWGSRSAADNPSFDPNPLNYDQSMIVNPGSSAAALLTSNSWDYSGLPGYFELNEKFLTPAPNGANPDPSILFSILLHRSGSETSTSEGRSAVRNSDRLNTYRSTFAAGHMTATSTSEVFFERPVDARHNKPGSGGVFQELASLFNPYWQTRLVNSPEALRRAQLLQGVTIP